MLDNSTLIRFSLAALISILLAVHGKKKKSLSNSGAIAAIFVGFISFATSYRFGMILILFYYTGSKFTKIKEDTKAKLEDGHLKGGQRNYIQVFANSILATLVAITFYFVIGEDVGINFGNYDGSKTNKLDNDKMITVGIAGLTATTVISKRVFASFLSCMYCAHYACAAGDTWASELGILSKHPPRLVTSLFLREVPRGTNGGMSLMGTLASAAGGCFIGFVSYIFFAPNPFASSPTTDYSNAAQYPIIIFGLLCGVIGSLFDSLLGATLQASYYSTERKCIVKEPPSIHSKDKSIVSLSGIDVLSNEAVNALSILLTMITSIALGPWIFCLLDSKQCTTYQSFFSS